MSSAHADELKLGKRVRKYLRYGLTTREISECVGVSENAVVWAYDAYVDHMRAGGNDKATDC